MTADEDLPEHVAANRAAWDSFADEYASPGEQAWTLQPGQETWGLFGVPEAEVRMFPDDLVGRGTVELGCGTGYVSAWMARRGARPVGLDNSPRQLATAARLQRQHGLEFPLILGNAEKTTFPASAFDFAISEYGAVLWADPEAWVHEAARILRPGGRLHVLTNHMLTYLASPEDPDAPILERLERPMFGMGRTTWAGETSVEFHPTHGDWIRIFNQAGFEVLELLEPKAPDGAATRFPWMSAEWAGRWPCEEIWKVRKRTRRGQVGRPGFGGGTTGSDAFGRPRQG